jgi:hypothetical protein
MKRLQKLLIFSALCFIFPACSEEEVGIEIIYPEGKLKEIVIYDAVDLDRPARLAKFFYDADTQLVKEEYYMYPDELYSYYDKTYDEAGRLVRQRQYILTSGTSNYRTVGYTTYEYDAKGKLVKQFYTKDQEGDGSCLNYLYLGDTAEIALTCTESLMVKDSTTHIYHKEQLVRESFYSGNHGVKKLSLIYAYRYEYDQEGRLIKKYWIDGIPNTTSNNVEPGVAEEYFYNDANQLIESRRYDPYWGFDLAEKKEYVYY